MEEKMQFSEIYINGIRGRAFCPKEDKEQVIGEIMLKVFELSEQIRKRHAKEDTSPTKMKINKT